MHKFKPAPFSYVMRTMRRYGHVAGEPARSAFVFYLLSFADLDDHPCRAAVEVAFSPSGSAFDRVIASARMANAGLLGKEEYPYAIRNATRRLGRSGTAISSNVAER